MRLAVGTEALADTGRWPSPESGAPGDTGAAPDDADGGRGTAACGTDTRPLAPASWDARGWGTGAAISGSDGWAPCDAEGADAGPPNGKPLGACWFGGAP
jgi:hypothetical protein